MAAQLEAVLSGQDQLSGVLDHVKESGKGLSEAFKVIGEVAIGTFVGDIAGEALTHLKDFVTEGLHAAVDESIKAEESLTRLDATLKASAGASGMTHDSLVKLAEGLQDTTTYSHTTAESAEAVILRFHDIGQNIFPQVIQTSADMAAALGMDLPSAATALGKALTEPGVGLLRLKQYGVDLSESQKETIKELMGTSKELVNLTNSATKATDGMPKLQLELRTATDQLATMTKGGKSSADQLDAQRLKISELKDKIAAGTETINQYNIAQNSNIEGMSQSERLAKAQTIILDALKGSIGGTAQAMGETLGGNLERLKNKFTDIQEQIGGVFMPMLKNLTGRVLEFVDSPAFKEGFANFINGLRDMLERGIAFGTSLVNYLAQHWNSIKNGLDVLRSHLASFTGYISATVQTIISYFQQNGWRGLAELVWVWIKTAVGSAGAKLGELVKAFKDYIDDPARQQEWKTNAGKIGKDLADALGKIPWGDIAGATLLMLFEAFKFAIELVLDVATLLRPVADRIGAGIHDTLLNVVKSLGWGDIGKAIVDGIGIYFNNGNSFELGMAISRYMFNAMGVARNQIGAHSPSTLFAEQLGRPMVEGIALGIMQGSGSVMAALSGVMNVGSMGGYGLAGSSSVVNNHNNHAPSYNLHINSSAPTEPIIQDFYLLQAIAR